MKILVLNCGSSSIKYKLIQINTKTELASGIIEKIPSANALFTHKYLKNGLKKELKNKQKVDDHFSGVNLVLDILSHPEYGVIKDKSEIFAIGHRVVHGGEKFTHSVLINEEVKKQIEECIDLAPLHNPPNLKGIYACEKYLPNVPQVAVFDTAFHSTLPSYAYTYPLPLDYYKKYSLRKYGFHGTSHAYVLNQVGKLLKEKIQDLKIITCHLGNGCSITAIKDGKSIDTSMGLTPLEGLMMGTRCGDIDPSIPLFLVEKGNLNSQQVDDILNKKSGLLGVSGISNDMREILKAIDEGNETAKLAFDMFVYRIKKYIGAYVAIMNGLDVLVFTAGIGENSLPTREKICDNLQYLGIILDKQKNIKNKPGIISSQDSQVKVMVIPTDEELIIAEETERIVTEK